MFVLFLVTDRQACQPVTGYTQGLIVFPCFLKDLRKNCILYRRFLFLAIEETMRPVSIAEVSS